MKKKLLIFFIVCFTFISLKADEGMWLLSQLKSLELQKKGFELSNDKIYNEKNPSIKDAIVLLGGGTAEIVSPKGLILTNHHVAFGAVQRASTKGVDLINKGFLAKTNAEEIEAPGYSAQILQYSKDISSQFKSFNKIKNLVKRDKAIKRKIKSITDKIEKKGKDINARVVSMFSGLKYMLYVYKRFDDVRVVYVPPASIGNYGGEIDNWMWPRHTADFSFMRIYMAPDGTGREYNKENVPYKPKYWLKIAKEELKLGDETFIMGFPGRTTRNRTSYSVAENVEHRYPFLIKYFGEIINILEEKGKASQIASAKVAGLSKGLHNAMKNYKGNVEGMKRNHILEKKRAFEAELLKFLKSDKKLNKKFGTVLTDMEKLYKEIAASRDLNNALGIGMRLSGTYMSLANDAYYIAKEKSKKKSERDPGFSLKDIKRMVARMKYTFMSLYVPSDKALFVKGMNYALSLKGENEIKGLKILRDCKDIKAFADNAYKKSKIGDLKFAKSLFSMSVKELEALNDPFINIAKAVYSQSQANKKKNEKTNARLRELRKKYIEAVLAWKGDKLYPDANSTLRISYGVIEGYSPRDAVIYKPFTTLKGVVQKDTGKTPFDMPAKLKELYEKKDFGQWKNKMLNDVPVDFTHKVDSTGGNSGSPVMNKRGELIGILFDGNYEALTGDWQYDGDIQRTISVDIKYVMFIVDKFANATTLLKELGL